MARYTLTAAKNMSDETYAVLENGIKEKYGIDCTIERITDDSVIGGFIFNCDGKIYDCSISAQLEGMKKFLKESQKGG